MYNENDITNISENKANTNVSKAVINIITCHSHFLEPDLHFLEVSELMS